MAKALRDAPRFRAPGRRLTEQPSVLPPKLLGCFCDVGARSPRFWASDFCSSLRGWSRFLPEFLRIINLVPQSALKHRMHLSPIMPAGGHIEGGSLAVWKRNLMA